MRGNTVISTLGMLLIEVDIKSFSFLKIGTFDSSQLFILGMLLNPFMSFKLHNIEHLFCAGNKAKCFISIILLNCQNFP